MCSCRNGSLTSYIQIARLLKNVLSVIHFSWRFWLKISELLAIKRTEMLYHENSRLPFIKNTLK